MLVAEGAASVTGAPWALLSFRRSGPARERAGTRVVSVRRSSSSELAEEAERRRGSPGRRLRRHDDVRHDERSRPCPGGRRPRAQRARRPPRAGLRAGRPADRPPERAAFDETHERLMGVLGLQAATAIDTAHGHADLQQALAGRPDGRPHEGRVPLDALPRAAHPAQRHRGLGPPAAGPPARTGRHAPRGRDDRAQRHPPAEYDPSCSTCRRC